MDRLFPLMEEIFIHYHKIFMLFKNFFLILFLILSNFFLAQNRIIGEIVDSKNKPISEATIYLEGTFYECDSDLQGSFVLELEKEVLGEFILVAEKKGYEKFFQKITLNEDFFRKKTIIVFEKKVEELESVLIKSNRNLNKINSISSEKVDPLEVLVNTPDANIITSLNGVSGAQQEGDTGELSVRGGAGNETSFFFDGMLLKNQLTATVQNQAKSLRFSPNLFENIELISGGFSVEYGQALSSVLIMKSKDLVDKNTFNLFLSPFFLDANAALILNKKQSLEINLNLSDFSFYTKINKPDLEYQRLDKGPKTLSSSFFYKYKINDKTFFKFFSYISTTDIIADKKLIENQDIIETSSIKNLNTFNIVTLIHEFNKKNVLKSGLTYSINDDFFKIRSNSFLESETLSRQTNDLQLKSCFTSNFNNKLFFKSGFEYFKQKAIFSKNEEKFTLNNNLISIYDEVTLKVTRNFFTNAGLRYEYLDIISKGNLSPRFNFSFVDEDKKFKLSASYGLFYQEPSLNYLSSHRNLNFSKSEHQILEIEKKYKNHIFKIDFFNKKYKNLVTENDDIVKSDGFGYAKGFDFLIKGSKVLKKYTYRLTYSFLDSERLYLNFPKQAPITFAAKNSASFNLNRNFFGGDLITGLTYNYNSGRHFFNPNNSSVNFNSNVTKPYSNLSANFIYSIKIKNTPILLISTFTNILRQEQIFGYEYSEVDFSLRRPIKPLYKSFVFFGCYIDLAADKTNQMIDNILNN